MRDQNSQDKSIQGASNSTTAPSLSNQELSAKTQDSSLVQEVSVLHPEPHSSDSAVLEMKEASTTTPQLEKTTDQESTQVASMDKETADISVDQNAYPMPEEAAAPPIESDNSTGSLTSVQEVVSAMSHNGAVFIPLTQAAAPVRKFAVGKIVLVVLVILALLVVIGGWGLNRAVSSVFEEQLKEQIAQKARISPDQVTVEVEGGPRLVQVVTGKYQHIVVHAGIPASSIMSSISDKGAASSVVPVTVVLQDVDAHANVAKHLEISYTLDASTVNQYLMDTFGGAAFPGMSVTHINLIDGGFHVEGEIDGIGELGVTPTLKIDNTLRLDKDGNLVVAVKQATIEALGESLDITKDLGEEPEIVNPANMSPFMQGLRLAQFDITSDGVKVNFVGEDVNLNRMTKG